MVFSNSSTALKKKVDPKKWVPNFREDQESNNNKSLLTFGTKPVHPGGNEPSSMSTAFRNSNVDVDTNPTTLNITPIAATINPWGRIGNKWIQSNVPSWPELACCIKANSSRSSLGSLDVRRLDGLRLDSLRDVYLFVLRCRRRLAIDVRLCWWCWCCCWWSWTDPVEEMGGCWFCLWSNGTCDELMASFHREALPRLGLGNEWRDQVIGFIGSSKDLLIMNQIGWENGGTLPQVELENQSLG